MKRLNSLKRLFNSKPVQIEDDGNSNDTAKEDTTKTLLSIGENKNARSLTVTFHPDAFFANMLKLHDEPPLNTSAADDAKQYEAIDLQLKQHSPKIMFTVTISNKLCELGYVRVNATEFMHQVQRFMPVCLTLERHKIKRQYLYIPMTVQLPALQQRPGLFADRIVPALLVAPSQPTLYRYKLTEAFLWRYQYVRIREYPSLKLEVIGEIPCDLHLEMIGYPVRAVLPDFMDEFDDEKDTCNYHLIDKELRQRSSSTMTMKKWSLLENAFWVKLVDSSLKTLPLMTDCMDELEAFVKDRTQMEALQQNDTHENDSATATAAEDKDDYFAQYFIDKGYIIQQYLGHTVLQKIGPLLGAEHRDAGIPIAFDTHNNLFVDHSQHDHLEDFPPDLIAHIFSFCSFEFVRRVLCRVDRSFSKAAQLPSCYRTAILPLITEQMLQKPRLDSMTRALNKCTQIDVYSLISQEQQVTTTMATSASAKEDASGVSGQRHRELDIGECLVDTFHLEFVTEAVLHYQLFHLLSFSNLRCLKLSQCHVIQDAALTQLPDCLEELYLLNTIIGVKSWHNLQRLRCLIVTKSVSLQSNNQAFLQNIADTLPPQRLQTICIWDGQDSNKSVIKQLTDQHNDTLAVFGIGGRICLYRPFSDIFTGDEARTFSNLQILTVSCLSTNEIAELLVGDLGHQLRVLELFCPFVMEDLEVGDDDSDSYSNIYEWILGESTVKLFCSALSNLEVLMCQAFPHDMKKYMTDTGWEELRLRFEAAFNQYRPHRPAPIVLFDFGMDLNKMPQWTQPNICEYLLKHQRELELNFGQGI